MNKQFQTFTKLISKMDAEQFTGLCTILCVPLDTDSQPREFAEVLSDVLDNFCTLPRRSRRDLLKVLTAAQN